MYATRINSSRY